MEDLGALLAVEEGAWVEVILIWEQLLHFGEGHGHIVFPRDDAHGRELIDLLQIMHFL